jgi:hypothetical protein
MSSEFETETTTQETQEVQPAGESFPTEDAAPSIFDWNGELDSLAKADWYTRLDEPTRNTLSRGFEQKYRNFERGYTKSFQETAKQRKEIERREAALRDQELKIQRWLTGDADPMAEKQREIDTLKAAHDAALSALRDEYEQSVRKASDEWTGKYGTAERERDELRQKLEAFEYEAKQAEERQLDAAVTEVEDWLKSEASDVYENDEAFYNFCVLCTGGTDPESGGAHGACGLRSARAPEARGRPRGDGPDEHGPEPCRDHDAVGPPLLQGHHGPDAARRSVGRVEVLQVIFRDSP